MCNTRTPDTCTAFVLREEIRRQAASSIALNLKVGQIPVTFEGDVLWMKQVPPRFGSLLKAETIAQTVQIPVDEIDARFPIQEVSTGVPFLTAPLKHLAAIKTVKPHWNQFVKLTSGAFPRSLLIFCPEPGKPENQLHVRVFVDELGVPEDPATGSGNGSLAGYLVKYRYMGENSIDVRVEQGYEIQRPSLLLLRAREQNGTIDVNVGGKVFLVARGELV